MSFRRSDVHFVWVRCHENYDFLSNIFVPTHVINKCCADQCEKTVPETVVSVLNTDNLGDESVGYLYWILKNYGDLPEHVVFAHGEHRRSFVPFPLLFESCLKKHLQSGYINLNFGGKKKFISRHLSKDLHVRRAAEKHYEAIHKLEWKNFTNLKDAVISTVWGNTWIVSRDVITQWPQSFYNLSYQSAIDNTIPQVCDSCVMYYNKNGQRTSSREYSRHTEVGIYYEYIFDYIWRGAKKRMVAPSASEIHKFIRRTCNPDEKVNQGSVYWKRNRKFSSLTWAEFLNESRRVRQERKIGNFDEVL